MKYINTVTGVMLETDSHLEGGDWSVLEEPKEEISEETEQTEETEETKQAEPAKPQKKNKK